MDRIIYTAMNGAQRILEQQAAIGNNLANVGTDGFRKQLAIYRSVPVTSPETLPTRVSTVASTPGSDFGPGAMVETGRPLDLAVTASGRLAVQTPTGQASNRAGTFTGHQRGLLVHVRAGPGRKQH